MSEPILKKKVTKIIKVKKIIKDELCNNDIDNDIDNENANENIRLDEKLSEEPDLLIQFNNMHLTTPLTSTTTTKVAGETSNIIPVSYINIRKNRNAGGKNTNVNGKNFEDYTNIVSNLQEQNYLKYIIQKSINGYYYMKKFDSMEVIYTTQSGFKMYVKHFFKIDIFRNPDEAYIIKFNNDDRIVIKILEKKTQSSEGSVETKLWAAPSLKREYEIVFGDRFIIEYALCFNTFLHQKIQSSDEKYVIFNQIAHESNIRLFNGNSENYANELFNWIYTNDMLENVLK